METSRREQPLFIADEVPIYLEDFSEALRTAGLDRGDIVMIHSDISVFGKLASFDRNLIFSAILDAVKDVVTEEGLLIMPTFTYSFCDNLPFDPEKTKSKVGALTEYFRTQPGVVRTVHPIFSFALWGTAKESFLSISKDSFDTESLFGKFHRSRGKIVFLGAPFQSCTFLHYIEQMHGVPYRYMKPFDGVIRDSDREYRDTYHYFVRDLGRKRNTMDATPLEKALICNGSMKVVRLGNGRISLVTADQLYKETTDLLDRDIEYLLKET